MAASTSSSATGISAAQQQQQQEDQTNMLLHNISKIERFNERESSSSSTTASRTSRFMPHLGKHRNKKRDVASYSGQSAAVSEIRSKSFNTTSTSSTTITNTKKNSTTTPPIPLTTITKNTLKNICKSTPNISTLTTRTLSSNASRNASNTVCESAAAYRQRRKAVPTIYDFGVTLRLHFQSLDYNKSTISTTTTASSSSSSSTAASSSTKTSKKKDHSLITQRIRNHVRKASLDEKDSGSCSGSSIVKEPQRSSVDISITLTDDESSNSRISDTGKFE